MNAPLNPRAGEPELARPPDFETAHFRSALGQFATGVTIITTRSDETTGPRLFGFTANSFNSVSLEPPLVLWSLSVAAGSLPVFRDNTHYAVNVLASDQIELSRLFGARSGSRPSADASGDRFDGIGWREGFRGAPILDGCCAWFECFNRSRYEEGDHVIFVGEVERCGFSAREPLVFQGGAYHRTQPHPDR